MPALDVALDADRAAEALTALLGRPAQVRSVLLRRHRPGRRALVEYALADGTRALAKVRAKGLDRRTLRLTEALWAVGFEPDSDVAVPEPLGAWPEAQAWVQRHVDGADSLGAIEGPDGEAVAARIARALVRLHREGPLPTRRHALADELAVLHARVPPAVPPAFGPRAARLLDACDRLAKTIPPSAPGPLHRDFYPDNVLVTPERIVLLDLDLYALGDPALDAGNFVAHLVEHALRTRGDADALDGAVRAFVSAFAADDRQRAAVEAWTALALVRQLAVYARIPSRQPATAALLDTCERRLLGARVPEV